MAVHRVSQSKTIREGELTWTDVVTTDGLGKVVSRIPKDGALNGVELYDSDLRELLRRN